MPLLLVFVLPLAFGIDYYSKIPPYARLNPEDLSLYTISDSETNVRLTDFNEIGPVFMRYSVKNGTLFRNDVIVSFVGHVSFSEPLTDNSIVLLFQNILFHIHDESVVIKDQVVLFSYDYISDNLWYITVDGTVYKRSNLTDLSSEMTMDHINLNNFVNFEVTSDIPLYLMKNGSVTIHEQIIAHASSDAIPFIAVESPQSNSEMSAPPILVLEPPTSGEGGFCYWAVVYLSVAITLVLIILRIVFYNDFQIFLAPQGVSAGSVWKRKKLFAKTNSSEPYPLLSREN